MKIFAVKYLGNFGFIKPWTAVRDGETFSQQFLTPSIIEGIEKKLFPHLLKVKGIQEIKGHRLSYDQLSSQTEQIQPRGWNSGKLDNKKVYLRERAILTRSVLINPKLWLTFSQKIMAEKAAQQHICLCRNEDILFPIDLIETNLNVFNNDGENFFGYELVFEKNEDSFIVGYNRYMENDPMYGWIRIVGNPVKTFK